VRERLSFPSLRPAYYLAKWKIKNVSSLEKPLRQVGEVGKYNIAILFICHFAT
jgi:hypothetical protein